VRILVVDDDPDILNIVKTVCKQECFEVETASSAQDMWRALENAPPDLIVLDIMLPDASGLDVVKKLKKKFEDIPVIFLTARKSDLDMILGLELGADDYITKPFNPRALVARIKAVIRRYEIGSKTRNIVKLGDVEIDMNSYSIIRNGKKEELPRKEFELLKFLLENPGKVLTRQEILDKVWGVDFFGDFRTVDVHISKLRERIGNNFIKTVRGVGYKFVIPEDEKD